MSHVRPEKASTPKRKFAILYCEDEPKWGDEGWLIWKNLLKSTRGHDEDWTVYRTAEKGELPLVEDDLDGVLIPGSHYSAYEPHGWIEDLCGYIRACYIPWTADANATEHVLKPQIVGSCFGAQVVARALGGSVAPNPGNKYIVRAEEVLISEAFVRQPFADGLFMKTAAGPRFQPEPRKWRPSASKKRARPTLADASGTMAFMRITQTHGDSVVTLPADSQVLGTSRSCTNEIFLTGKNILSFQGHPEFTWKHQLMPKVLPYVFPERMTPEDFEETQASFKKPLHSYALIEVCRRFIKKAYRETYAMYHAGAGPGGMNDPSREPGAYVDTGGLLSRSSGHIRPGGASPMPGAASPKYPSLPVACEAEVETRSPALAPPLAGEARESRALAEENAAMAAAEVMAEATGEPEIPPSQQPVIPAPPLPAAAGSLAGGAGARLPLRPPADRPSAHRVAHEAPEPTAGARGGEALLPRRPPQALRRSHSANDLIEAEEAGHSWWPEASAAAEEENEVGSEGDAAASEDYGLPIGAVDDTSGSEASPAHARQGSHGFGGGRPFVRLGSGGFEGAPARSTLSLNFNGYGSEDDAIAHAATAEDAEEVLEDAAEAAAREGHLLGMHQHDDPFELATAPLVLPLRVRRRLDRAVKEHATPRAADGGDNGGSDSAGAKKTKRGRGRRSSKFEFGPAGESGAAAGIPSSESPPAAGLAVQQDASTLLR